MVRREFSSKGHLMIDFVSRKNRLLSSTVVVLSVLSVVFVGCGKSDPTGTVHGNVTLNGEPYSDAAVAFTSLDTGRGGIAQIQDDGSFRIETPLLVGTYKVYLEPKALEVEETAQPQPIRMSDEIPAKYWDESSSDISIEVVEGDNEVTVPLTQ